MTDVTRRLLSNWVVGSWLWLGWRGVAVFGVRRVLRSPRQRPGCCLGGAGLPPWGSGGGWEGEFSVVVGDAEVGEACQVDSGCSGGEP